MGSIGSTRGMVLPESAPTTREYMGPIILQRSEKVVQPSSEQSSGSSAWNHVVKPVGDGVSSVVGGAASLVAGTALGVVGVARGVYGIVPMTCDYVVKPIGTGIDRVLDVGSSATGAWRVCSGTERVPQKAILAPSDGCYYFNEQEQAELSRRGLMNPKTSIRALPATNSSWYSNASDFTTMPPTAVTFVPDNPQFVSAGGRL